MPENEAQAQEPQDEAAFDFDGWLGEQPEHVRKGYEGKTQGLVSALDKERKGHQDLARELKRLEKIAGEGSEAQKALGEMSERLERAERERDFIREASKPEIGCANPDLAFLVAQAKDLFKRSGEPDWIAIKAAAPELFGRTKAPPGNGGNGRESPPARAGGMNEFIRQAARGG